MTPKCVPMVGKKCLLKLISSYSISMERLYRQEVVFVIHVRFINIKMDKKSFLKTLMVWEVVESLMGLLETSYRLVFGRKKKVEDWCTVLHCDHY